jgi:hypothetical protein
LLRGLVQIEIVGQQQRVLILLFRIVILFLLLLLVSPASSATYAPERVSSEHEEGSAQLRTCLRF